MRIISNFLANTCCYSSQVADQEEPEVDSKNIEKMLALSLSLAALHESLRQMTQALNLVGGGTTGQIRRDVQSGCILAGRLWNVEDLQSKRNNSTFRLRGHIEPPPEDEDAVDENDRAVTSERKRQATVDIGIAKRIDTDKWLQDLKSEENPLGAKQLEILDMILKRRLVEAREIRSNTINTSAEEPLRHMIQGLPGAGKSEIIKWRPLRLPCFPKYYGCVDQWIYASFLGRCASDTNADAGMAEHELEYPTGESAVREKPSYALDID